MKFFYYSLFALCLTSCVRHPGIADRPASWADQVELRGVENVYRVSPRLYRSEQPGLVGMQNLERLGIQTIVSLRAFHSDRDLIAGTNLGYERITFQTWDPEFDELVRFLKIATDPHQTPVLVHCLHGSDRTGVMCAAYRVVVQGWTKAEAIREMKEGGYGHHKIWIHLDDWIEALDVEKIRGILAREGRSEN